MTTLADFLLARIAEDEAAGLAAGDGHWRVACILDDEPWIDAGEHAAHLVSAEHQDECAVKGWDILIYDEGGHDRPQAQHIARHDPARVLAECEAKRRIVSSIMAAGDPPAHPGFPWILQNLALPYADHEDYRDEWRP